MLGRPMAMNQTNYGLRAKEGVGDYFVYFTLSEMVDDLRRQSYGTIFDTITTNTFENTKCALPTLEAMQRFESSVSPLVEMILTNQRQSRTLTKLRDALLPKLISGELSVQVE